MSNKDCRATQIVMPVKTGIQILLIDHGMLAENYLNSPTRSPKP